MSTRRRLPLPLTTVACSLTFGGCARDAPEPGDGQRVRQAADAFVEALCESYLRCVTADVADRRTSRGATSDWGTLDGCIRYYGSYADHYAAIVAAAPDPAACELALSELLECYQQLYAGSCEDIYCEETDPECEGYHLCDPQYEATVQPCDSYDASFEL